ncbi:MAG: UDP-N-acetylmuramoyl-L-alanine--D-glutamate ligase, partial [Pseudomonadota bacterium]
MIDLSNFIKTLSNKPVAVFGLGVSGLASVKALVNAGIKVIAWDDKGADVAGAECKPLTSEILAECACLILAPGVPLTHP